MTAAKSQIAGKDREIQKTPSMAKANGLTDVKDDNVVYDVAVKGKGNPV